MLEERISGTTPDRQYVWGLRYIDDLVLRDRSVAGTLDERLYALQDANWNMVAICDTSGSARAYDYSAYGVCTVLNPDFSVKSDGTAYDWTVLYMGRSLDDEIGFATLPDARSSSEARDVRRQGPPFDGNSREL